MSGHDTGAGPGHAAGLVCEIALPPGYRVGDLLAFHGRDAQQLAERVDGSGLRKGLLWGARPALLSVRFEPGRAIAALAVDEVAVDEAAPGGTPGDRAAFERTARRLLGLTQPIVDFEAAQAAHPLLGPLVASQAGLRVPQAATPFEALAWAIAGQQISLAAALSLRRRLIAAAGVRHSTGLLCHPDAPQVARLQPDDLRAAGFSQGKARTLLTLARQVAAAELPLADWIDRADAGALPVDELRARLSRIPGIGPWTIDYALLRGFAFLDGSLHGDVAVRRRLRQLLGAPEPVSEKQARAWLSDFSPWRALVAAHLWAGQKAAAAAAAPPPAPG